MTRSKVLMLAVFAACSAAGAARAQTPVGSPPAPTLYTPTSEAAAPAAPAVATPAPVRVSGAVGGQCQAFFQTFAGPRTIWCPLRADAALDVGCGCPFPPPPPGIYPSPPLAGHVVP